MFEAPKDTKISLTSTIEDASSSPANPFNQATKKIINFHPTNQNDIFPTKNTNTVTSYDKPAPTSEIRGLSTISASNDDDDTDLLAAGEQFLLRLKNEQTQNTLNLSSNAYSSKDFQKTKGSNLLRNFHMNREDPSEKNEQSQELLRKGREETRGQSRERTASQGPMPKNLLNRYLEIVGGNKWQDGDGRVYNL